MDNTFFTSMCITNENCTTDNLRKDPLHTAILSKDNIDVKLIIESASTSSLETLYPAVPP